MAASPPPPERQRPSTTSRRGALILLVLSWTFAYNVLVKQQSPGRAFFGMLDTISDDFVMGTLVAVTLGVLILLVFSVTKLYTQLIANVYAFHILEDIVFSDFAAGRWRRAAARLITLEDQPVPVGPRGSGLTGGDVDADWARAESAGEEAVGGSVATPDQDVVDEIGRALGVEQGSEAEVVTSEEILRRRDRFRWHLERDAEERERRTEEEPEERRARERGEATPP